ncbi:hypothetical protein C8R43DRAFT_1132774 [Mycena crocata]|nr:hypothetical protein C8R43DRAFT_1132774 [Mycena crocata]
MLLRETLTRLAEPQFLLSPDLLCFVISPSCSTLLHLFSPAMSVATPFLGSPFLHDKFWENRDSPEKEDVEGYESEDLQFRWTRTRLFLHREEENLGMWAASLKIMAGTQHLLPTVPISLPLTPPHYHPYPHSVPFDSRVWAPPASPQRTRPSRVFLATEAAPRGVLYEASAVCNRIMHISQVLEHRSNVEHHLSRKTRPPPLLASVVHPAATSTVTAVMGDWAPTSQH